MKLQTNIPPQKSGPQIDYKSKVLLLGSCFAENIGSKLAYFKFQHLQNPFGILFQPKAIEKILYRAVTGNVFTSEDIFFHLGRWQSFDVHSSLGQADQDKLLGELNRRLLQTQEGIREATHIVLTFGTAWVYNHLKTDSLVANCHKLPQKEFAKELLSTKEVVESIEHILSLIRSRNKEAAVLFTISPVRHLRDGFIENQRSKAHLISALHYSLKADRAYYYPAYEIMMDELRDYRFYKEDLVHPNTLGINYIWEHFRQCWINDDCTEFMGKVDDVQKGLKHVPFDPDSEQHRKFVTSMEQKIAYLQNTYPFISF